MMHISSKSKKIFLLKIHVSWCRREESCQRPTEPYTVELILDGNSEITPLVLGASEITANLYCNCVHLYWEGCVICSIYLR